MDVPTIIRSAALGLVVFSMLPLPTKGGLTWNSAGGLLSSKSLE